jgi:hypothetical protein
VAKYDDGKDDSQKIARAYEEDRDAAEALGAKLGPSLPLFSVSIAMASMCLLTKKKPLWLIAIFTAAIATLMMVSACLAESQPRLLSALPEAEATAIEALPVEVEVNCGWGDTLIVIIMPISPVLKLGVFRLGIPPNSSKFRRGAR